MLQLHMADLYRAEVMLHAQALEREDTRMGAAQALRGLIDGISMTRSPCGRRGPKLCRNCGNSWRV